MSKGNLNDPSKSFYDLNKEYLETTDYVTISDTCHDITEEGYIEIKIEKNELRVRFTAGASKYGCAMLTEKLDRNHVLFLINKINKTMKITKEEIEEACQPTQD